MHIDGIRVLDYTGSFSGFGKSPMMLGSYNGQGYFFSGDLDEVSIWKSSLNKRDVKKVFNSGVATNLSVLSSSVSLIHWWRMGDHKKDSETIKYDFISKKEATLVE